MGSDSGVLEQAGVGELVPQHQHTLWERYRRPLGFILLHRLLVGAVIFVVIALFPGLFAEKMFRDDFHWPPDQPITAWTRLTTWDGQRYLYLSQFGYSAPDKTSAAWYPLWPMIMRGGAYVLGGNHLLAGLVLSNLISLVALLLFYRLVREHHGQGVADGALILLLCYPSAFYFALLYSESLFFLLIVLLFTFLVRRRYLLAGLVGFLLPLTRPVGIFVVCPLAVALWMDRREGRSVRLADLFCLVLPLAGYASYFAFMHVAAGDALAAFHAQENFASRASIGKLLDLKAFLVELVTGGRRAGMWVWDRLFFVVFCCSLPLIWRTSKTYLAYAVPAGFVAAVTVSLMSFPRYMLVVFPVFIAAAILLSRPDERYRFPRWVLPPLLAAMQVVFLVLHINSYWVE